jgi:hypothetical protein
MDQSWRKKVRPRRRDYRRKIDSEKSAGSARVVGLLLRSPAVVADCYEQQSASNLSQTRISNRPVKIRARSARVLAPFEHSARNQSRITAGAQMVFLTANRLAVGVGQNDVRAQPPLRN